MKTEKIIEIFKNSFNADWPWKEPLGLVSSFFPNTFNPSGGHDIAGPILRNSNPVEIEKFYTIERCFRDIDIGIVGTSHHLSFFEMLTFGTVGFLKGDETIIDKTVAQMANLLFTKFGLDPQKIFVAYFNGGTIGSIYSPPPSTTELSIWKKYFTMHVVPIPGRRTFIYSLIEDWPAGPGFEIFYDRGSLLPDTIRFLEIASVNFYKYLNKKGNLHDTTNWALGGGIGLERLATVLQESPTIYDIDVFLDLKDSLLKETKEEEILLYRKSYNILMDHLRSTIFILMDGQKIDNTSRGKILRRLIKRLFNQISYLNLQIDVIEKYCESLINFYSQRYSMDKKYIINNLLSSFSKFNTEEIWRE